jgi:hypothetical protein
VIANGDKRAAAQPHALPRLHSHHPRTDQSEGRLRTPPPLRSLREEE